MKKERKDGYKEMGEGVKNEKKKNRKNRKRRK